MGTNYHRTTNFSTNETLKYHDDACLFRLSQRLCQAVVVEPHLPYSQRFDFVFPHSASPVGPSLYNGPTELSGVYVHERHLLPPTYERYFNSSHYCTVTYSLQAVFQLNGSHEQITVQLPPLDFLPVPGQPDPLPLVEYVRPPEKLSDIGTKGMQKFAKFTHRGKATLGTPSVTLTMKASVPAQILQSSTLAIHACVELDSTSGQYPTLPSIDLRIKSLVLLDITFFRARIHDEWGSTAERQETGDDSIPLSPIQNPIVAPQRSKPSSEGNTIFFPATFEARIPESIRPSFRTFNINHNFQLKVTLEADVLKKKVEHTFVVRRFTILPGG